MGLDIYLYRYEDYDQYKTLEQVWEDEDKAIDTQVLNEIGYTKPHEQFGNDKEVWGERDYSAGLFTEAKYLIAPNEDLKQKYWDLKKEKVKARATELGYLVGDYGDVFPNIDKRCIEINSSLYPDHMFKIGYLRSSYNGSGTNNYLKAILGKDLYTIFNPDHIAAYSFQPDWKTALETVREMIEDLQEQLRAYGNLHVDFIETSYGSSSIHTKEAAMTVYKSEKDDHSTFSEGYSNAKGHFYHKDPMQLVAAIPGEYFKSKGVYLVYTSGKDEPNSYLQGLEITREMIEWILVKPRDERDKYYLHWSS